MQSARIVVSREQERRAAAAAAITAAEQRAAAAAAEQAQVREEATARLAQLDALLHQLRRDHEHQRTEAEQRLAAEQARGEANETRLMRLLDQLRTEHAAERQVFTADRQDWRQRETALQTQLTAHQRETHEALRAQAIAEDRQQALRTELERARTAQQASEERYRQAVHEQETLRAAFDTVQQQCQHARPRFTVTLKPSGLTLAPGWANCNWASLVKTLRTSRSREWTHPLSFTRSARSSC